MIQKILKVIDFVLKTNFAEEEVPPFPNDFLIVDYSPIAKQNAITTEQNKIIYRYCFDKYGNKIVKRYPFLKARLNALRETYNIPFIDKTIKEDKFPVFSRILPSEVKY